MDFQYTCTETSKTRRYVLLFQVQTLRKMFNVSGLKINTTKIRTHIKRQMMKYLFNTNIETNIYIHGTLRRLSQYMYYITTTTNCHCKVASFMQHCRCF